MFPNGTLRINNVEVYDAHVYSCETQTVAGQLYGQARVTVLGKLPVCRSTSAVDCTFLAQLICEVVPQLKDDMKSHAG